MTQNKLRVKGVNSGGEATPFMLYNIDLSNTPGFNSAMVGNYIRYNPNGPQILTNILTFDLMGRGPKEQSVSNQDLLQSIAVNQLIRITQEDNPSIYQQFRVMGTGLNYSEADISYTVAFDEFTISDFSHGTPVIVTVV